MSEHEIELVTEPSHIEKIDYIYNTLKKFESMEAQFGPMLAQLEKSPIFKMMGFKK